MTGSLLLLAVSTLFLPADGTARTDCFTSPKGSFSFHVSWAEVSRRDDALVVWIGRRIAKGETVPACGRADPPESMFGGEVVEFAVAPRPGDDSDYYHFIANPSNVLYKARRRDATWVPTVPVVSRSVFEEDRWGVELTVPYAALDVERPKEGERWHLNFATRTDRWAGAANYIHDPRQYGTLVFGEGPQEMCVEAVTLDKDGRLRLTVSVPTGPQEGDLPHKSGGVDCNLDLSVAGVRKGTFTCRVPDGPAGEFVLDRFYYPASEALTVRYAVRRLHRGDVRIRRLADDAVVGDYPDVAAAGTLAVGPLPAGEYVFEMTNARFRAACQFEVCATNASVASAGRHYPIVGSEKLPSAYLTFARPLPCRFTRKEAVGYVYDPSKPLYGAAERLGDAPPSEGVLYRLAYEAQLAVMLGSPTSVTEHVADRVGFYTSVYRELKARYPKLRFSIHADGAVRDAAFASACDVFECVGSYSHELLRPLAGSVAAARAAAGEKPVLVWLGAAFPDNGMWRTAEELNAAIRYCILKGGAGNVLHLGHGGVPESNTRLWSFMRGVERAVNAWYPVWAEGADAPLAAEAEPDVAYGYRRTRTGAGVLIAVNLGTCGRTLKFDDPQTGRARILRLPGCGSAVLRFAPTQSVRVLSRFMRPSGPRELSALSRISGDRYLAVDDSDGRLHELEIPLDEKGAVLGCRTNRSVRLAGRTDLEGCAWDPLERRVWVSDETDGSVRQFDPETGAETAVAPVPEVFRREAVRNRSLEALAIAPDGLRMYAANEDTLRCDGAVASTNRGGVVRIQEFVRTGAGSPWTAARSFRYRTRRIRGADWNGLAVSGVSALWVEPDGSLLVLEREFSRKNLPFPTFHARLSHVRLPAEGTEAALVRTTLWEQDTGFLNFEGLSTGPVLRDGTRTWLLVSDAGGGAEANVLVLGLRPE